MNFQKIRLEDRREIDSYMMEYGEKSCQHNFAALYALQDKYSNLYCEEESLLYIRQMAKDEGEYQSFLMPIGGGDRAAGIEKLLNEVHGHGKLLKLQTVTESAKEFLETTFPKQFELREERKYAEYLYRRETLEKLSGRKLKNKRYDYMQFHKQYASCLSIEPLKEDEIPEILSFQQKWMQQHRTDPGYGNLIDEFAAIQRVCASYRQLGFSGITIRLKGVLAGYAMGCPISDGTFDMFFEKGSLEVKNIYRALVTDMVRMNCQGSSLINREEDLDDPGLRESKLAYQPDLLMKKYIVKEL